MCGDWTTGNVEREGVSEVIPPSQRLGQEGYLSEVGTSPPHNCDTPHGTEANKTTTTVE